MIRLKLKIELVSHIYKENWRNNCTFKELAPAVGLFFSDPGLEIPLIDKKRKEKKNNHNQQRHKTSPWFQAGCQEAGLQECAVWWN